MGRMGRDMGHRSSPHRRASAISPSTWSFLAPPVGIEPTTCGLGTRWSEPVFDLIRGGLRSEGASSSQSSPNFL